jgi:hypothetical protein
MIKWKRHHSLWRATCNREHIGTIKHLKNGDYCVTMNPKSAIDDITLPSWFGLSLIEKLAEFNYKLHKERL